ncbi:20779_t:CDS:2, partial [Racocetra persica]
KTGEKKEDYSKKDLRKVLNPDFDFGILRKEKAQEILDIWKNWSSSKNSDMDSYNTCVTIGHLQINFACDITKGTEDGVRNVNKEDAPIASIQPKNLKKKCDADRENLEINEGLINIEENKILDFYLLSDVESDINDAESGSESPVQKYPNIDSPKDNWPLPSGRSISIIYDKRIFTNRSNL